ncbi:hypothetical protein LCGC14_0445270 [marine sediment metagenome]|uniref:Uncharacterized protein n=1 Tax=marine sediment metagenome TaxID=412755 RepID=A0A0F9SJB9_9ZZZZ
MAADVFIAVVLVLVLRFVFWVAAQFLRMRREQEEAVRTCARPHSHGC